jgi:tetratricopeptide (TPR) repeat protein
MSNATTRPDTPPAPGSKSWVWICLGLAALGTTSVAYLPSLRAGFYFDDLNNIVDLPAIHWNEVSLEGLRQVASTALLPERVVANVTFALNHVYGGLDPTGYHVVNLLIHLMVGVALMWVCFEYTTANHKNRIGASNTAICSVAAATLFLVHPLNTQAVSYVVQRMASMASLFVLVSFGCYLHARRIASSRGRVVFLLLALLAWVLGILSKETAVVLPAVVLAYELVFHGKEWRGRVASALADPRRRFVAIGLFAAGVAGGILLVGLYIDYSTFSILKQYPNRDFNGLERVLTQFRVQIFYLFLLLWPAPSWLSLEHDFAVSTSLLQPPATLIAILFWVACVALVAGLLIRRPRIGFPLLAYLIFHAIESAPLNLELVFEHRMYLPMTMLALLLATVLVDSKPKWRRRVLAGVPVIAIVLAGATYSRNLVWADPIRFHTDCVSKAPNKFRPLYNLGSHLGRAGRLDEAQEVLARALEIKPTNALTHNQLGNIALLKGDLDTASEHYETALESKPDLPEPLFNLGLINERLGNPGSALDYYHRFVESAAQIPFLEPGVVAARDRIRSIEARMKTE